jgi:hypothetical protein
MRHHVKTAGNAAIGGIDSVVARDGIEPPTPAFSGPRSTTELPGLSEDFQLRILRGIRRGPGEQCPATTRLV